MSTAAMRTRLAKLEKRQRRLAGRELTDVEKARRIGFSLYCAAHQLGTQDARDAGRCMAIMLSSFGGVGRYRNFEIACSPGRCATSATVQQALQKGHFSR